MQWQEAYQGIKCACHCRTLAYRDELCHSLHGELYIISKGSKHYLL